MATNTSENSRRNKNTDRNCTKEKYKELVRSSCCKKKNRVSGKTCIELVDFSEIMRLRNWFWSMNEEEQNSFILNTFENQSAHETVFSVDGRNVCVKTWLFVNGIGKTRFYSMKDQHKKGRISGETNRKGAKQPSEKTCLAINWLNNFANDCGDHPPDESYEKRILPACYTRSTIYATYQESVRNPITEKYFMKVWREHCNFITISKNNKFAKCGVCTLIKEAKRSTKDAILKKQLEMNRKFHNEQQKGERLKYYHHREKSRRNPERYASIIIDGMDQNKTSLPYFLTYSKSCDSHFLKTHITGAIAHARDQSWQLIDLHEWKHDSNYTLSVLLNVLQKIVHNGSLPPILYLQFDNCWRENKNQFVLAFCCLLVKMKIVRKIRLSYLIVGHTHEDIDSTFGHISTQLSTRNAPTLHALESLIKNSYNPNPKVERIRVVYDFKNWLKENIRQITNHTEPHAYRFELNSTGEVGVWFKRFNMDRDWTELKPLLSHVPNGNPNVVKPTWEKQIPLAELKSKLKSCRLLLKEDEIKKWQLFVDELEQTQRWWSEMLDDSLMSLTEGIFVLNKFKRYNEASSLREANLDDLKRQEGIDAMLEKAQRQPRGLVKENCLAHVIKKCCQQKEMVMPFIMKQCHWFIKYSS